MVRLLVSVALLGGCFDDEYHCDSDEQCNLGIAGRCETNNYCTVFNANCTTSRRSYSAHSGDRSGTCFDDQIVPLNACTGGQPPAAREGCFAQVCEVTPACCDVAWTDVCVELAQQLCDVRCDTRLAVTATRGATIDHFDATWTGTEWRITPRTDLGNPFVWIAPPPGATEPRLAGTAGSDVMLGDFPLPARGVCTSITSNDFDRDGRDTIVVGYATGGSQIVKPFDARIRDVSAGGASLMVWGDINRDGFSDAINFNDTQVYRYLDNLEDEDDKSRRLELQGTSNVSGGATPGPVPQIRKVDWLDLNADTKLDIVVFGNSIRIHTIPGPLTDVPQFDLDCDPPDPQRGCMAAAEPDVEAVTFTGAGFASTIDPGLVIAVYPDRKLYRARLMSGTVVVEPLAVPGACTCPTDVCTNCPGPDCKCTYDCSTCATFAAIAVRDVDGDHQLDIIAIDSRLRMYTALAPSFVFGAATAFISPLPAVYDAVDVSIAGAPIL